MQFPFGSFVGLSGHALGPLAPFVSGPRAFGHARPSPERLRTYSTNNTPSTGAKEPETPLIRFIKNAIRVQGPLTVAQYMVLSLTSDLGGYYMRGDVFGKKGDFITGPEISQMYGEVGFGRKRNE